MSPNPMFAHKTQMHLSKFPIIGHTVSNSNIPFTAKVSYIHADNTLNALEAILFPRELYHISHFKIMFKQFAIPYLNCVSSEDTFFTKLATNVTRIFDPFDPSNPSI